MINLILTLVVVGVIVAFVTYFFRKRSDESDLDEIEYTIESAVKYTLSSTREMLRKVGVDTSNPESIKQDNARQELSDSIDKAPHGSVADKLYVKAHVKSRLMDGFDLTSESNLNKFIPFDRPRLLTPIDMFDIILYHYRYTCDFGVDAFDKWIDEHNLMVVKPIKASFEEIVIEPDQIEEYEAMGYVIDRDGSKPLIRADNGFIIYAHEVMATYTRLLKDGLDLSLVDKINIVTQRVYSKAFGMDVIDELLDMNINGIRGGSGGYPESADNIVGNFSDSAQVPKKDYQSIRLFFRGNQLHLDFLEFENRSVFKKIVNTIYLYGKVGQLNSQSGYKFSTRADQSRVVVGIPEMSDSPGFFVRKFDPSLKDLRNWFRPTDKNWEMIYFWIMLCAASGISIVFSGAQGAGKTTIMRGSVKFFPFNWNIRVMEGTFFELWLRLNYWWKDIFTIKETPHVSGSDGSAFIRRVDGTMTIYGEVVTEEGFTEAVQNGEVGSLGIWFSFHNNSVQSLMQKGSTSLVARGASTTTTEAVAKIANVIQANMHLENVMGHRRMQRFSQIWETESEKYPVVLDNNLEESLASIAHNIRMNFEKTTEMIGYSTDDLFRYSSEEGGYVKASVPSKAILTKMKLNMEPTMRPRAIKYLKETFDINWEDIEV